MIAEALLPLGALFFCRHLKARVFALGEPGEISKSFSIPIVSDNVFEIDETVNLTLSNPTGGATLGNPTPAKLTIKTHPLLLVLEESEPGPHQVAALDSLLFRRDPFPVISQDLFNSGLDRNTRVIVFVTNLQLAQGDVASNRQS